MFLDEPVLATEGRDLRAALKEPPCLPPSRPDLRRTVSTFLSSGIVETPAQKVCVYSLQAYRPHYGDKSLRQWLRLMGEGELPARMAERKASRPRLK